MGGSEYVVEKEETLRERMGWYSMTRESMMGDRVVEGSREREEEPGEENVLIELFRGVVEVVRWVVVAWRVNS